MPARRIKRNFVNEITHGDCLEVMKDIPDDTFDITITSPPYNTFSTFGGATGAFKTSAAKWIKRTNEGYKDEKPEAYYQAWLHYAVKECLRVCKGTVWINHKVRFRNKKAIHPLNFIKFDICSEIIWNRTGSMDINPNATRFSHSHEAIYGFGFPHYWDNRLSGLMTVWNMQHRQSAKEGIDHPCPFPPEIPKRLIKGSCPPSGVVFDPFVGSGTTAVEAIKLGRDYFGIDNELKFVKMSREAIKTVKPIRRRKK